MRQIGPHSTARFRNRRAMPPRATPVERSAAENFHDVADGLARRGADVVRILRDEHDVSLAAPRVVRFFVVFLDDEPIKAVVEQIAAHSHEGVPARIVGVTVAGGEPVYLPPVDGYLDTMTMGAARSTARVVGREITAGRGWILVVEWLIPVVHAVPLCTTLGILARQHNGCVVGWEARIAEGEES